MPIKFIIPFDFKKLYTEVVAKIISKGFIGVRPDLNFNTVLLNVLFFLSENTLHYSLLIRHL